MSTPNTPGGDAPPALDATMQDLLRHLGGGGVLGDLSGLDTRDYEALYAVGHHLYSRARYPEAAQVFGFLVLYNHQEPRYLMAQAASLQMCQDWGTAISVYTLVAMHDPSDLMPCFHTCECLLALGLKAEAREGLAMIVRQCDSPAQAALRTRAQALLDLLAGAPQAPAGAP